MAVPAAIVAAAQTYGPTLARAAGNYLVQQQGGRAAMSLMNTFAPGIQGNMIGSTYSAKPVTQMTTDPRFMQNPQQMSLQQQELMRQQMDYENQMGRGNTAFNAGIANAGANTTMQRQMARDAQTQRANAAANMMQNTANAFGNTLQQSTNGMANVLSAFR